MSKAKTKIGVRVVHNFLNANFDKKVSPCVFLKGGEVSQAFSFKSRGRDFVIRVTTREHNGFAKDKYAYEHFSSYEIPVPEIIEIGRLESFYYAISEKISGRILNEFSYVEIQKLMPEICKELTKIHAVDISTKNGFGEWNRKGLSKEKSWKSALFGYIRREDENWGERYGGTFFEREFFDQVIKQAYKLENTLDDLHYLIHADYGFDNVFSDGKKITGVIDWEHSKYGDFLYDVAWLEFWGPNVGYAKYFKEYYTKTKKNIDNWDNRLLSCMYYFAIGAIGFFAVSEQKEKYLWAKDRLTHFLKTKKV